MDTHIFLAAILACIGLTTLYVVAEWFDPAPISLLTAKHHIDQTVTVQGTTKDITFANNIASGTITATCKLPFKYYTKTNMTAQNATFIGIIEFHQNKPVLWIEQIKN
jgi:hypothetical protein